MSKHDVIVIGGSAGAVAALVRLAADLPADLPASVFVVVHFPEDSESLLPSILNREGRLPAAHAGDREPVRLGRIYVAPPGRQMTLRDGRIELSRGPAENGFRPAIDPLFRSAAREYGNRVIGVVISGTLDDGTAGLADVKKAGGVAIVQDPEDAQAPGMPQSAREAVEVDYTAAVSELGALLVRLAGSEADAPRKIPPGRPTNSPSPKGEVPPPPVGKPTLITCPDCHGVLSEIQDGKVLRYQCQVGHAYSPESVDAAQSEATERALWAALRALRERVTLMNRLAERSRRLGHEAIAERFEGRVNRLQEDIAALGHLVAGDGDEVEPGTVS